MFQFAPGLFSIPNNNIVIFHAFIADKLIIKIRGGRNGVKYRLPSSLKVQDIPLLSLLTAVFVQVKQSDIPFLSL